MTDVVKHLKKWPWRLIGQTVLNVLAAILTSLGVTSCIS